MINRYETDSDLMKHSIVKHQVNRLHPFPREKNFDPEQRLIGIMMIREESDVLEATLRNVTQIYDRILVLDGTEPDEEFAKSLEILKRFEEVVCVMRDRDTDGPFPIRDGARHYLLQEVRKRYGSGNWIGILHGDEFYTADPRPYLALLDPSQTPIFNVRLCHTFLHVDDEPIWDSIKHKSIQERITHYMWPGTPEDRIFYDDGKRNFDPAIHSLVVPLKHGWGRYFAAEFTLTQYNYRNPEQMRIRAQQRINSKWQKNHYLHIAREDLCFVETLHVPGYDPCGYDNVGISDPSMRSKPRSTRHSPLPILNSSIRPVFIGGSGRSGSTLIKECLGGHPQLGVLKWEAKFLSWANGLMDLLHHFDDEKLEHFRTRMQNEDACIYPEHLHDVTLNWKFRATNELHSSIDLYDEQLAFLCQCISCESMPLASKRSQVRHFVHYLFDRVALAKNGIGWIEQTPRNIYYASELMSCFPDGIFINIYRDPRDVIASLLKLWWGPSTVAEGIAYYKERYQAWTASRQRILNNGDEERALEIRFEDLIEQGPEALQPIYDRLGLAANGFSINRERAHIGRWRTEFTSHEQSILNAELGDILSELQYQS